MKILVIDGSPKGDQSNTMVLTKAFLEGAGWAESAEFISSYKANVKDCVGCYSCWTKTPGVCIFKDDMVDILPKLIHADVVIWSFPCYHYNVPGQLKTFIDRTLPLALPEMVEGAEGGEHPTRYDLSKQKYMVISTCGFWTHEGNYDAVNAMFDRMTNNNYQAIYAGQGGLFQIANLEEIPPEYESLAEITNPYLDNVRKAGKEFAEGKISQETLDVMSKSIMTQEDYERESNASW